MVLVALDLALDLALLVNTLLCRVWCNVLDISLPTSYFNEIHGRISAPPISTEIHIHITMDINI